MVQIQLNLTKQESNKLAILKIVWNKNNKKEVVQKLIADQRINLKN